MLYVTRKNSLLITTAYYKNKHPTVKLIIDNLFPVVVCAIIIISNLNISNKST